MLIIFLTLMFFHPILGNFPAPRVLLFYLHDILFLRYKSSIYSHTYCPVYVSISLWHLWSSGDWVTPFLHDSHGLKLNCIKILPCKRICFSIYYSITAMHMACRKMKIPVREFTQWRLWSCCMGKEEQEIMQKQTFRLAEAETASYLWNTTPSVLSPGLS